MECREVMTEDPACCLPEETASAVAEIMRKENVGAVPVINDQKSKQLVGIVTDRDLAIKVVAQSLDANKTTVREVMTSKIVACRASDDAATAIEAMEEHQIRRLPIVDDDGRIVGIISQADVATRLNEPETTAEMVEEISQAANAR